MSGRPALFTSLSCLFLLAASCAGPEKEVAAARAEDPLVSALVQERSGLVLTAYRGRVLYQRHCAVCHGDTGEGDGFNAYNLNPSPRPLKVDLARLDDAQVAAVIREGSTFTNKSPLSPPYGRFLSGRDVADITAYLRALNRDR